MKFCLFNACFLFIRKRIKCIFLTPNNHLHHLSSLVSINEFCLFKQFKDVYDSETVVLHGIISKSDEVNVQFWPYSVGPFWGCS